MCASSCSARTNDLGSGSAQRRAVTGVDRKFALLLSAALALFVGLAGCQKGLSEAELRGAEHTVRRVHFEGVTRFDPKELHDYLEMRPTDWAPLPTRHWYYDGLLPVDAERILELYASYGYYEARIVGVRTEIVEQTIRDRVDIFYVIDEGPVTTIEELVVRWPEGPPPGPPRDARGEVFRKVPPIDPQEVSQKVTLELGGPFEVEAMVGSQTAMRNALRAAGHPYASVEQRATVDERARVASVEFEVRPGPFMRIGEITVEGLQTVPLRPILVELERLPGEPYSPTRMEEIEQRVYAIGMFSMVSVVLEERVPADQEDGVLDITVRVREGDPQRVRLGFALGFEPNRWEQRIAARYRHNNVFRDLYVLQLTGRLGYAELPSLIRPLAHGPVVRVDLHGEKKGLLEKQLVWTVDPRFEVGIEQGYQFVSVSHRFGVSRFFTRWFSVDLSHGLRYVNFFAISPTLREGQTLLGLDFRDPYVVSFVGLRPTIWAVDQVQQPNDGAVIGVDYRVAGGPFGGQFDFHAVSPFVRAYWRPHNRFQLAVRGELGMILPFGDQPGAPIDMRLYLGGTASMRGWGRRRLSPRVDNCEPGQDPLTGACESIPIGGNTSVLANVELRVRTWGPLWAAVFLDVGDVQPGVMQFEPSQWNYAAGGGLRVESPVGKFRLDAGFRLNETPLGVGEPIWALHFGLGESF